jgi:hypothetical protein
MGLARSIARLARARVRRRRRRRHARRRAAVNLRCRFASDSHRCTPRRPPRRRRCRRGGSRSGRPTGVRTTRTMCPPTPSRRGLHLSAKCASHMGPKAERGGRGWGGGGCQGQTVCAYQKSPLIADWAAARAAILLATLAPSRFALRCATCAAVLAEARGLYQTTKSTSWDRPAPAPRFDYTRAGAVKSFSTSLLVCIWGFPNRKCIHST